jgi:hypothetical protein
VTLGTQPSSRLSLRGQTRVLSHSYHNWLNHKNIVMRPSLKGNPAWFTVFVVGLSLSAVQEYGTSCNSNLGNLCRLKWLSLSLQYPSSKSCFYRLLRWYAIPRLTYSSTGHQVCLESIWNHLSIPHDIHGVPGGEKWSKSWDLTSYSWDARGRWPLQIEVCKGKGISHLCSIGWWWTGYCPKAQNLVASGDLISNVRGSWNQECSSGSS